MSESTNDHAPATQGDPEGLGDAGKKALQAERARADAAEKRLREVEADLKSQKGEHETVIQKLNDQLKEGTSLAEQAIAERDRFQVAYSKQVPADLIEFLQGSTPDELTASAEKLMAHIGAPKTPVPDPMQGASGQEPPTDHRRELLSQVFKNP